MKNKFSLLKKSLCVLLIFACSRNLLGMNDNSIRPINCFDKVKEAFNQEYKIEPSSPLAEGLKFVGGVGCILVGACVAKKSFEHSTPMVCGGAALAGLGLSLMAWIKPGKFRASKQENELNNQKNNIFSGDENKYKILYEKEIKIPLSEYQTTIYNIDNNANDIGSDIKEALQKYIKAQQSEKFCANNYIKEFIEKCNYQKNKSLLQYLFTRNIKEPNPTDEQIKQVAIRSYIKKEILKKDFKASQMTHLIYAYYLAAKYPNNICKDGKNNHSAKNDSEDNTDVAINIWCDDHTNDTFSATFNGHINPVSLEDSEDIRTDIEPYPGDTYADNKTIFDLHKKLKMDWGEEIEYNYKISVVNANYYYRRYGILVPYSSADNNKDNNDNNKGIDQAKERWDSKEFKAIRKKYKILSYPLIRVLYHKVSGIEERIAIYNLRKKIEQCTDKKISSQDTLEHSLDLLAKYKKTMLKTPCVIVEYMDKNNTDIKREYIIIKRDTNEYSINVHSSVIAENSSQIEIQPSIFTVSDKENITEKTIEAIKVLQEKFKD